MAERYQNKYRIASARAAWWHYGWAGAYFITICTANRRHYFGKIENGKMHLSHAGVLADAFWYEIPHHTKHVELGAFVVMPNHIHGILVLDNENGNANVNVDVDVVETRHALSLPPTPPPQPSPPADNNNENKNEPNQQPLSFATNRFQNQGKNTVSSIVGSYKSAVTKHANRLGIEMAWQARFHVHIIRNDPEYQRINDYIETNVVNWENDKFFKPDQQP